MPGRILVGTSSWADPGFVEEWYPQGMPARERLGWYAERFEVVELNSSFYAVPERGTVARWARATPPGFTFDVKLHRLLSRHAARIDSLPPDLRDGVSLGPRGRVRLTPELESAMLDATLDAVAPLEEAGKLGSFLLQLTPAFSPDKNELDELRGILAALHPRRVAIELRNRLWVKGDRAEDTLSWMSENGAAYVAVDAPREDHVPIMPPIDAVTRDDLAYMRLHGRNAEGYMHGKTVAERFAWDYSDDELQEITGRVGAMAEEAGEVHVLFNNNRGADAPTSARRFRELVGQDPGPPPREAQLRVL
ncbi:MAG: hypothetical protein QOJ14_271 [Thermoleophilaceae bacterium]|jgi:uncharacterized protein YecE (DUF72 family)|nr:hypothetical protein [Thermoleophilaceae bacterium]